MLNSQNKDFFLVIKRKKRQDTEFAKYINYTLQRALGARFTALIVIKFELFTDDSNIRHLLFIK